MCANELRSEYEKQNKMPKMPQQTRSPEWLFALEIAYHNVNHLISIRISLIQYT